MHPVTRSLPLAACAASAALALGACSSIEGLMSGDKIDYRSCSTARTSGLEVPPDLTQLTRDSRYQQTQGSSVSATAFQASAPATGAPVLAAATPIAPQSAGDLRIERLGNERWLSTSLPPEKLWPQLQAFWKERGFVLKQDEPTTGVMETDWAENRAKLPLDLIRTTIGKAFDSAYSTGELDKFRTRVERTPTGTEVYITHRGMIEIYTNERRDNTTWQPRPADPQLEGELLSRLMLKLGATDEAAKTAVAGPAGGAAAAPARARIVAGQPTATLQVDDGFDRAWRRVGVALDRSGFTVEDRDRTQGIYFVRYIDPKFAGRDEPGLLSRIFSFGKKDDATGPIKYRVVIKSEADRSLVTVLNAQGGPENGDAGKRISTLLLDDLK